MKILVGYYSRSGNTKKMAEAIARGIADEGMACDVKQISDISVDELLHYEGLIFGSPTYYGQMAAELKKLFDDSVKHHGKLTGKVGGAFTSSGMMGGGGETTIFSIFEALLIHGMIIAGDAKIQHYGPLAVGAPDKEADKTCTKYGKKIAVLTKKLFGN
ncbi:MAG: NAD(P)H-dependent oxidoreductase [candidate division WOR-3 bacterium]|nr:NAD(P)H-dependent oxidoreductase [candidate division WOR-3 bacterium]